MSANNGAEVLDRVKRARADRIARGEPPPGRPILVRELELPDHQVRKALETIRREEEERLARERELAATVPAEAASLTQPPPKDTERHEPNGGPGVPPDTDRVPVAPALAPAGQPTTSRPLVLWPQSPAQRLAALNEQLAGALESASAPESPPAEAAPPPRRPPRPWPLVLIGVAAAVGVWAGWVGLGQMCGWGVISPLPGIRDDWNINSAIALPISVEAYAAYALRVWLSTSTHGRRTVAFARWSTIASLVIGGGAQVAYHLMVAAGYHRAPWPVVTLVALVPVAVLGLASSLAWLVIHDTRAGDQA